MEHFKNNLLKRIMLAVKGFNNKHRKLAGITTFFTVILITILSLLFSILISIGSVFGKSTSPGKRFVGLILILLLLGLAVYSANYFAVPAPMEAETEDEEYEDIYSSEDPYVIETDIPDEMYDETQETAEDFADEYPDDSDTEIELIDELEEYPEADLERSPADEETAEEYEEVQDTEGTEYIEDTEGSVNEDADVVEDATEDDLSEEPTENEDDSSPDDPMAPIEIEDSDSTDDIIISQSSAGTNTSALVSEADIKSYLSSNPDCLGWVYIENTDISYPIIQGTDNDKYKSCDYNGDVNKSGSIFLDYRSVPDFSDVNSIVYGHNMKDGSMFGSLRKYRDLPGYYKDHEYFQIITGDRKFRYHIVEFMDVPVNYELYNYVGDKAALLIQNSESVERKSYLNYDIILNSNSRVVTLSTCTPKDTLQFVIMGLLVDEADY